MNNAMATLAEMLGIENSTMPREQMAEVVCEAAITRIGGDASQLNSLAEENHAMKDRLSHSDNMIFEFSSGSDAMSARLHEIEDENEKLKAFVSLLVAQVGAMNDSDTRADEEDFAQCSINLIEMAVAYKSGDYQKYIQKAVEKPDCSSVETLRMKGVIDGIMQRFMRTD